jgi:hypothetical protein
MRANTAWSGRLGRSPALHRTHDLLSKSGASVAGSVG